MILSDVKELLHCTVLCGEEHHHRRVESCFSADLMSDVLAFAKPHGLLITGLNNAQSVRAADVVDAIGIVYVRGKTPSEETVALARAKDIPILVTDLLMFEVCGILYKNGISAIT